MLNTSDLRLSLSEKRPLIRKRLSEFSEILNTSDEKGIFEELAFCIFTAGTSAKMGINAIQAVKDVILEGSRKDLSNKLKGVYRFPNSRAEHVIHTREYLRKKYNFKLKNLIISLGDPVETRDFFALNKDIKGIGFKESSHFLRNVGFKGYAILDKHLLNCLHELKVIKNTKPPTNRKRYIEIENKLKKFAKEHKFDLDEIDLLLWSEKTGAILK